MQNKFRIFLAIVVLTLAALACQTLTGGNGAPVVSPTDVIVENTSIPEDTEAPFPTVTEPPTTDSDVLLDDDFTPGRDQWGTGTDADSSVEYVDDALNLKLFTENFVVWTTPNGESYENIHMEVTVLNNGTDSDTAFGMFCYQQYPIDDSRYYFAVTPTGEYAIAKAALAVDDEILTNGNTWAKSDLIKPNAASYRIGADCGNGTLTLYVDGQEVDSVSDSTYTGGGVAVFGWSGKKITKVDVSFDDFLMTKLP
jgi:hypothetical protein